MVDCLGWEERIKKGKLNYIIPHEVIVGIVVLNWLCLALREYSFNLLRITQHWMFTLLDRGFFLVAAVRLWVLGLIILKWKILQNNIFFVLYGFGGFYGKAFGVTAGVNVVLLPVVLFPKIFLKGSDDSLYFS